MAVITISRQYASGGSDIAKLVAQALGWTLIDNEFVDRVAQRAGLSTAEVEVHEERVPGLIERLARALSVSSPEMFATAADPSAALPPEDRLVRMTETVITEAVQQGNVVLVGRGAPAYLAERANALHVYIVAPRDARIEAALKRLGVSRKEAEKAVDNTDAGRRRYVKEHYGRVWEDSSGYDLIVNTGRFTYAQAAAVIVEAAVRRDLAPR